MISEQLSRRTDLHSKLAFTKYFTLRVYFCNLSDPDLSILDLLGKSSNFPQVPVRNRHLARCTFVFDQEFQILV